MHKIVDINEAIIAYLDGEKVRRHITMEEFVNNQKMRVKKTNKRVRIITDNNTMNADGSMLKSFTKRLKKAFYGIFSNMHSKSKYIDEESNMI